jgi:hypothetical protein
VSVGDRGGRAGAGRAGDTGRWGRRAGWRSTRGASSGALASRKQTKEIVRRVDARRDRGRDARLGIDARLRLGSLPRGASRARGRHRGGGRAGLARRAESPRGDARVHRRPYSGHPARRLSAVSHERASGRIGSRSLARAIAGACVDARGVSRGACACRGRRYSSARRACALHRATPTWIRLLSNYNTEVKFYIASRWNVIDNRSRAFRRLRLRFQETLPTRRTACVACASDDARADARLVRTR